MKLAIERIYDNRRRAAHAALEQHTAELYAAIPALAALPKERQAVFRDAALRRIDAAEAARRLSAITETETALLSAHGFSQADLRPQFTCAACSDTGWIGKTQKKPCACRLLLMAELDPAIGINAVETFAHFRTDIFPSEEQKKHTLAAKKYFESYADALPAPEKPNVLLVGMSGLGKSYFGNAVAHHALSRGIDARRITAYALIEDALERIRTHAPANSTNLTVPLLVIDDLGSEAMIPNVTEETLFSLLNERGAKHLPTMVTTNLPIANLMERYGERIGSRLIDRGTTQAIQLKGENLRNRRGTC